MADAPERIHVRWGKAGDTRVTYMEERFLRREFIALRSDAEMAVALAEVARLREFLDDIRCGRGMFGLDAAVDLDWAVNHANAALTTPEKDTP